MTSRAKPILYRNVANTAWTGETARAVKRRGGAEGLLVMQYLMTCPYTTMLGVYRLVVGYMGAETALGDAGAAKGLRACIDAGFCSYDEESEFVFVHEFAKWQIGAELMPTDKRCKGVQAGYEALPDNPFLGAFFDRYAQAFHMTRRREARAGDALPIDLFGPIRVRPSEAPSMPGSDTRYQIPGTGTGTPLTGGAGGDAPPPPPPAAPPPPVAPAPSPAPKGRKARAPKAEASNRVPAGWLVSADLQRWARQEVPNIDIRLETANFRDCEFPKPHHDWDAAWRTWMRNAVKFAARDARAKAGPAAPGQRAAKNAAAKARIFGATSPAPSPTTPEVIDG